MKAVADRVIVREVPAERVSKGGVVLASPVDQHRGEVLSVGPRVREIQEGEQVIYDPYMGLETNDERGEPIVVLREAELIAKVVG